MTNITSSGTQVSYATPAVVAAQQGPQVNGGPLNTAALAASNATAYVQGASGLTVGQQNLADAIVANTTTGAQGSQTQTQPAAGQAAPGAAAASDTSSATIDTTGSTAVAASDPTTTSASSAPASTPVVDGSTMDSTYTNITARQVAILSGLGVNATDLATLNSSDPSAYDIENYIQQTVANPSAFDSEMNLPAGTTASRIAQIPANVLQNSTLPADTGTGSAPTNVGSVTTTQPAPAGSTSTITPTGAVVTTSTAAPATKSSNVPLLAVVGAGTLGGFLLLRNKKPAGGAAAAAAGAAANGGTAPGGSPAVQNFRASLTGQHRNAAHGGIRQPTQEQAGAVDGRVQFAERVADNSIPWVSKTETTTVKTVVSLNSDGPRSVGLGSVDAMTSFDRVLEHARK